MTIGRSEAGEMGTGVELSLLMIDVRADSGGTAVPEGIGSGTERSLKEKKSEKSGAGQPFIDIMKLLQAVLYCYR